MFDKIIEYVSFIFIIIGFSSIFTYIVFILKEQNLKKKYNAEWALVTGASSGIGKAITEKLAKQNINVVLVALDDNLLKNFYEKLKNDFPSLQFRAIGVDISNPGTYMDKIIKETEDITIQLLFNNAGYITVGLFSDLPLNRQLKNFEVNTVSVIQITYHFLNKMISSKVKSAIIFTSSPAGQTPSPFALMYGSTKAFLTEFGVSLASEVRGDNIDVLVVHPSPMNTNFYKTDTAHKSPILVLTSKFAYSPEIIANYIFKTVGNWCVVADQGYWSISVKILLKFLDFNLFAYLAMLFAPFTSEYKKIIAERNQKKLQ
jgi:short-subunit dehydrogenase